MFIVVFDWVEILKDTIEAKVAKKCCFAQLHSWIKAKTVFVWIYNT